MRWYAVGKLGKLTKPIMWIRFFYCTWLHTKTMSQMMSFRNNRLNADCDVHEIILHRIWRIQIGSVWFPLRVLVFGDFFSLLFILIFIQVRAFELRECCKNATNIDSFRLHLLPFEILCVCFFSSLFYFQGRLTMLM